MTNDNNKAIQSKLKSLGFYKGDIDGILGRASIQAIKDFQEWKNLNIKWPGTIGPTTLEALGISALAATEEQVSLPWLELARKKIGLHERLNNSTLRTFLRSDKKTLGDPSKLPWCGDFVETCLALTLPNEILPTNPYLARNWSKWGEECGVMLGAVVSFWRGSKNGTSGHVGFVAGQSERNIYVLGGNQSDRISIAPLSKDRVLAYRQPVTFPDLTIPAPRMSGGVVSTNEA